MEFSKRQRQALDLLLRSYEELTLGQIAERVGVSGRTIHRELSRIAPSLSRSYGITLTAKSGHGLRASGDQAGIQECLSDLAASGGEDQGPEERKRMLAALLLDEGDAVKILSLESDLGASTAAVRRDLESLRPWFESQGLALSLRRGIGVGLDGPESARRQALCSLFMEHFGEAGLLGLLADEPGPDPRTDPVGSLLLRIVPAAGLRAAEAALSGLPRNERPALAPRDYLEFVVHLAVGAGRRRRGRALGDAGASPGEGPAESTESRIARALVQSISVASSLPFDDAEAMSAEIFLRGSKLERPEDGPLGDGGIFAFAGLAELVAACGELLGTSFEEDALLREGLAAHWGPARYRIENGLPIRNPLLGQIREEYPALFDALRAAADRVFTKLRLPDDEIGYLVLHFGSSLERRSRSRRRFRALVVCSAGIGSAHMLASRIRAELPEIEIVASLSWFDVKTLAAHSWDLLVSTIPLPLDAGDYIIVSPLLPEAGIRDLRAYMERRRHLLDAEDRDGSGEPKADGLTDLKRMNGRLNAAIGLLERFRVFRPSGTARGRRKARAWEDFLADAIGRCEAAGLVADSALALRDLEARSKDRGMLLPGSDILFLHARSAGLAEASLTLHVLSAPPDPGPRGWERPPSALVLMVAPPETDRGTQDVLNEISSSFLDAGSLEVLGSADESMIRSHYSRVLDRYSRSPSSQGD